MADLISYASAKCKHFNNSLDESGKLTIAGFSEYPSRILFEMDIEAYKEAMNEFYDTELEDLKIEVFNNFPSCIAYNYFLSENGEGADDPVRKLLHLKDTWESIVFVLYAILMGEIRKKGINLGKCEFIKGTDQNGVPQYEAFNPSRIYTDAIKIKIKTIKSTILFANSNNLGLKIQETPIQLLDELFTLQGIRNDISHHAAPTRQQAMEELKIILPLMLEALSHAQFLSNCKIFRFESFTTLAKCENFNGHSLNRPYRQINIQGQEGYVIPLGQENLFVEWDGEIFSLSPFIHFFREVSGAEAYLSFFKKRDNGKYLFEPIKIREEKDFPHLHARFESEIDILTKLFKP